MRRLTISLDDRDYEQVSRLAQIEERSLSWVIGRAVKTYLETRKVAEQQNLFQREGRE